ncbi:TPA: ZmpA/ZmpB/ZmpC family metallo-endopeptidase [Streptococcus suis]
MHKFFYERRKAFSFRKLTIGLVSLCVSSGLLLGIHSQEVAAETEYPSNIRFEYVLEAELSAEERQLLQSALPAELREEATYFVVYRPSKKILPATGELVGSGLAVLGLGFLVLAVSAIKTKKARVLTMLFVTASGLVLPVLEVGAVQSSALAAYNRTYLLKPGETLPDGRLVIAGYEFVGYLVQNQSAQASLPQTEVPITAQPEVPVSVQPEVVSSVEVPVSSQPELVPAVEVPVSVQPGVVSTVEVPVSSQPELVPVVDVPVTSQPEVVPAVEVPVPSQPELAPAVEVPVSVQPEVVSTAEVPVSVQSEVVSTVEVPVPSQSEAVPAVEVPVTSQPEIEPTVEVPVSVQPELVPVVEVPVSVQPELVSSVEVPVSSQPEVVPTVEVPTVEVPVPSQPELAPTVEVPVISQPEMEPTVEVPVSSQSELVPVVEVPVSVQPEVVSTVEVPVPSQPELVPAVEVPVTSQPELVPAVEVPVTSQPELVPAVEVPVTSQPELVPAVEVPVSVQPEVVSTVEVPVSSQPELVPVVDVPVTSQPEIEPTVEVPVSVQPEVVSSVEVPVLSQPEVVPAVEVPVSSQSELVPVVEVPVSVQPELVSPVEVPVSSQPEMEPTVEVPVTSQPELVPAVEVPISVQPELVSTVEVPVSVQSEETTETDLPTVLNVETETPSPSITDANSGASMHTDTAGNSSSQELSEEEIQCILNSSLTCWPEKEEALDPKVHAQQIEEAVATLKERMAQLQAYRIRFRGKEWTDYIDAVYEASTAILDARDVADMRIQAELIEDDLSFLLHETDSISGASHKTEGELIFELPPSISETVAAPPASTTVATEILSQSDPATTSGEWSTESDEEFCPIVPQPEESCESGPEHQQEIVGQIEVETTKDVKFVRTYESNDQLAFGEMRTRQTGQTGQEKVIETYRLVNGERRELLSIRTETIRQVRGEIIEVGTQPTVRIERGPITTEYVAALEQERNRRRVLQEGQAKETSYRTIYQLDRETGQVSAIELAGEVSQVGLNRIISIGIKPTVIKVPLHFTETEIADGNLYVGERVIDVYGVDGERTVTTNYRLDTQTGDTQPEQPVITEVLAREQKVRIGIKPVDETRQEFKDTVVKFITEFESDENLSYPQTQVIRPGKDGLTRTIITRPYVRGQEVGQPSYQTLLITPVENKRVKVGIKPEIRIVEIPFHTIYEADSSRQLGTHYTRQEGIGQQITFTKTYSMNPETGQVMAEPEAEQVTRQGQNEIIQVGTRPTERTEEIMLETIKRDNPELEQGRVKVIHEGRPTVKRYQKNYTVDRETGRLIELTEVLVEEIPGQAREVEIGNKEPVQPISVNPASQPIAPVSDPTQTSATDTEMEAASSEKSGETNEVVTEDENRPLLRIVKNEPHKHLITDVRSTKVFYELRDEKNAFKKALVTIYVNDKEITRKEFTKADINQGKAEVRFKDLLPNVDYYIRTDLVYTDSKNAERIERIHDEVHVDFEERHFEIKNIDAAEVWKNEDGRLVRKVAIKVDPNDIQHYFIKLKSDEHKDVFLPVSKIDKVSLEDGKYFKFQAKFTNPEEKPQKISTYHDTVTVYLPRELREDYSTFSKLLEAMKSRPDGTFELKQDLTASEISLSASDKSYLSHQFRGTLKGNGFTIHDLKVPLFDDLRGTVSDLNLKAVDIHLPKETKVGALAKQSDNATVSNVHAQGRVFAENKIGGLIGESYQTNITNVSFKGKIAGLKNVDNNMIGGIAGWLGGGKIENGYVDATISATSSNVKAGGLVGQLENANTQIISSFATGSIATTKTKDTEVGGLVGAILKGNSPNNSIQLRDNIAAVHVVNGHKVYGRVEENLQPFSNIRTVVGKAIGENNPSESITEIDAAGAEQELNRWSIRPSEKEAERKLRQKNAFDIDYAMAKFALAERKQAYENMEKLLPFFTRDVIIQYGNRLEKNDELVTKKLLDVVPLVDKVPFLDILGSGTGKNGQTIPNRDKINGLLLHFADGTVKYQYLVKKKDLSRGAVTEYLILDKNISYTPEVMANDFEYKKLLGSLISEFDSITFESSAVQEALGLNGNSRDKEWLFLQESFEDVKSNLQAHLSELISNYNLVGLDSSTANQFLKSHISKNKAQLLLGLAYMNRWYNIQFGDVNAKNLMMKKADFFGKNVNSLDQLIRIGSMGAEMLKPKNNYALASQVIAKESIGGDLFDYLEGYRKAFVPKMTNNDWFKSSTKATIIETPSTIKEVLEKQTNPTKDIHHNGFYEKLAGENWKFKEMALILLAMPSKDIFILTDMANTLIGMYDNNQGVREERLQEIAKMWAGHADYLYNILPENHKEKMFRRTITWDTKRIGNDWKELDSLSSRSSPAMRHFYLPLGYVYSNESKGAHADTRMDGIYFFNHDAITEDGARVYTHEMTHIGDDNTLLLGHGKRTGLDFEVYARGLFESITWDNQDRFGINNIYDFSKYDERNYGRRLTNKTPDRFKSTQDLQDYMKGYLDVIYTLDLLEAEAVLGLSNTQAKQNWFAQMTTGTGNTSTVNTVNKVPTTLEQLIEEGMVSRRPYDYGYNGNANAYLEVRAFDPIYGSLNNDGTSRNEYEVRKIAFELLAEYGYENGMVPYLSDQHKNTLGQSEAYGRMKDSELISLISKNEYENSAAFRKAMFKERELKLGNLKPVELITKNPLNGNGYFYEGTRTVSSVDEIRRLMREAVEYDASNNQYFSNGHDIGERSRVYSLKAALLNGYLRATDDFRRSIYKDTP